MKEGQDIIYNKKIDRDFLTSADANLSDDSNLLVSTMPIPQLVQILPELSLNNHKLASSTYTCRFCLGYILSKSFFDQHILNHPFYNEYRYLTTKISDKIIYIRFIEFDNEDKVGVMIHSQTIFANNDSHEKIIKLLKAETQQTEPQERSEPASAYVGNRVPCRQLPTASMDAWTHD